MKKKNKRQRGSSSDVEEKRDRLSELPNCILLHIMEFMDTKHAIQTCVLSKRWEHLWKCLTNLVFDSSQFNKVSEFNKFVSRVLSGRDGSYPMLDVEFKRLNHEYRHSGCVEYKLLNRLMKYASVHNVRRFSVLINFRCKPNFVFCPYIFSCQSLTFLKLSIGSYGSSVLTLPKSLKMSALKSLQLERFTFIASGSGNDYAEPFSGCNMLNSLILEGCSLHEDAKFLSICNSNLSSLTIDGGYDGGAYKIVLSTPNLSSFAVMGHNNHLFSSEYNLSFLQEVSIETDGFTTLEEEDLHIISWLPMLSNIKTMTFSWRALNTILEDLSNPASVSAQHPCFGQLKSLRVKKNSFCDNYISVERINTALEYILQNSPLARMNVTFDMLAVDTKLSPSLTSLSIYIRQIPRVVVPAKSLHLPALKSMRLAYVKFTAKDSDKDLLNPSLTMPQPPFFEEIGVIESEKEFIDKLIR
ncbi:hypothetical protein Fmac_015867 [Flemingia macrophylla]|uniref:F-box domain-containing protein n=1 Tax=Flemingia macrophylla TaxID=520843 RepID=A0ABD1MFX7_9FABA